MSKTKKKKNKKSRTDSSLTRALKRRGRKRNCECSSCLEGTPCGWQQGLLLEEHSPAILGMRLEGRQLPGGSPVFAFIELTKDARFSEEARNVVGALSNHMVIIVADIKGRIASVQGSKIAAGVVVRTLGIDPMDLDQPWVEEDDD